MDSFNIRSILKAASIRLIIAILTASVLACGGAGKRGDVGETQQDNDQFSSYRAYDHFVKGDLYEQSGNFDAAAEEYRKALIFDPRSTEIRRALSEIYFQQRKFDEAAILRSEIPEKNASDYNFIADCLRFTRELESAATFYKRSLELDSAQYLPRLYLAKLYQFMGKNREAEEQYLGLIGFAPDKVEAYLELADFYLKDGRTDSAFEIYEKAARSDTNDIRPIIGMASIYLAKNDTLKADSLYFSIARGNWDDIDLLRTLIISFYTIGKFDRAEQIAARIAELAPDDVSAQRRYAMILFGNRKFADAESLMTGIERTGGADATLYYYLARIKQDQREFGKSEEYYRKSLVLTDTLIDAWINLALVIDEQDRYHEAIGIMRDAVERLPDDTTSILFYTSMIHSKNEKYELARDGYRRLLKSNPDEISFRFNLAAAQERLGNYDDAEKEFRWIIKEDPKNALALNYLGYMFADRGVNLEEAKRLIEGALEIEPDNGAFLDSYAWVFYKMGRYEEALTQMKKAVLTEMDDPVVYDHQGDIYFALNQEELARQSWEKALELKPDDEAVRVKLNPR